MKSIKDIFRSYAEFDAAGRHVNGTDKQSNHNYGDAYESLFYELGHSIRDEIKLVMEVGVADGSCLLAWREVFPSATVVGMDIHHSDRAHGDRIEFHQGDQAVYRDCERAAAGRQFDFIVEDGPHFLQYSLLTLFYLWPHVRPGGLYVIEEFDNIGQLRPNVEALYPQARILDTRGPFGGIESLVVLRKPA